MNKQNYKLKLNKVYERQFKMRKILYSIEQKVNEVEELHRDNYETIEILLDSIVRDTKNSTPENHEINGVLPTWNKVETKGGQ